MNQEIEKYIREYNVSRETFARLCNFFNLLEEWNLKINLVSKNSLADGWIRHVLDSMQLINYLPANLQNLVDIGSGAGFPGVVLAILLAEKQPRAKVYLVESITKKTLYLKDVCQKLGLDNVEIINERVENVVFKNVDVVTARAVAALDVLCGYAVKIGQRNTKMVLLKGRKYAEENLEAQKRWSYHYAVYPNKYSEDGVIMVIRDIRKKK